MTIEKFLFLAHTQTILSAVVAILCFVLFKSRSIDVRLIGFIFLTSFLANIISLLLIRLGMLRAFINIPPVIYLCVSLCLYSYLYSLNLKVKKPNWPLFVTVGFILFSVTNFLFIQKTTPNSYTYLLHSGILIVYSILYFFVLMRDLPTVYVHHLPMFWFNSGVLIFHAGVFFLFSFTAYLVNIQKNNLLFYWSFHHILSIAEHCIMIIGLYYDFKFGQTKVTRSPAKPWPNNFQKES